MIASTLSIALLAALDDRPTHHEIIGWIDVETVLLLFSMMILVGILTETGVFDHLAVYAYRVSWLMTSEKQAIYFGYFLIDHWRKDLAANPLPLHHHMFDINAAW